MKTFTIALFVLLAICSHLAAQSTQPAADREEREIRRVFDDYVKAMQLKQPERDAVRQRLLTTDYFYMGMDGLPASYR